jgi:hypothetical protein
MIHLLRIRKRSLPMQMIKNFTFLAVIIVGTVCDDLKIRLYHGRIMGSLGKPVELPPG